MPRETVSARRLWTALDLAADLWTALDEDKRRTSVACMPRKCAACRGAGCRGQLVLRCTCLTPTHSPAAQVSTAASTASGMAGSVNEPEKRARSALTM